MQYENHAALACQVPTNRRSISRLRRVVLVSAGLLFAAKLSLLSGSSLLASPGPPGREILVMRAPGGVSVHWCGNQALLISNDQIGIQWIDFTQDRRKTISSAPPRPGFLNRPHYPIGCTFDGKWVVYADSQSSRPDRPYPRRFEVDPLHGWDGWVQDLWRYELATGRRQRFAVVRSGGGVVLAPTRLRIFLGARHNSGIRMPAPRWEVFWSRRDRSQNGSWFRDSSGIVMLDSDPVRRRLVVEMFGPRGWTKEFDLDLGGMPVAVHTDGESRVYISVELEGVGWNTLFRCLLSGGGPRCERVLRRVGLFDVLANGEIVHIDEDENCIKRVTLGRLGSPCIVTNGGQSDFRLRLWGASPDGSWIVFSRLTWKPRFPGASGRVVDHSEVYVRRLERP